MFLVTQKLNSNLPPSLKSLLENWDLPETERNQELLYGSIIAGLRTYLL